MIADLISNKKPNPIITCLVFITQSHFKVLHIKDIRLNSTHYFILKISNRREFKQVPINLSCDTTYKDFLKIYKNHILS